jgi:hypothetical protein
MDVRAGGNRPEGTAGPAGEAAAGRKETPMKNPDLRIEIEMNHITRHGPRRWFAETLGEGATFRQAGARTTLGRSPRRTGGGEKLVTTRASPGRATKAQEFVSRIAAGKTSKLCRPASGPPGGWAHADPSCGIHVHVGLGGAHPPKPCGTWSTGQRQGRPP